MLKPCSSNAEGATKRKWDDIPPEVLFLPMVTMKDVMVALQFVKPSSSIPREDSNETEGKLKPSELFAKLNEFKDKYGQAEAPKYDWDADQASKKEKQQTT
jgi:hypothetical protein